MCQILSPEQMSQNDHTLLSEDVSLYILNFYSSTYKGTQNA